MSSESQADAIRQIEQALLALRTGGRRHGGPRGAGRGPWGAGHDHGDGHGDSHEHADAGHDHSHGISSERGLKIALGLTAGILVAEAAGAILTNSLALLSDAAHMLTDVTALVIALIAIRLSRRPADSRRTFGYYRFEILAAVANAVALFLAAIYILYEAVHRFQNPQPVASTAM